MGHPQLQGLGSGGAGIQACGLPARQGQAIGERQQWRSVGQGQLAQHLQGLLLGAQLLPPAIGQLQQAIDIEVQALAGEGPQQLDRAHLLLPAQQLPEGPVQARGGIALFAGEQGAQGAQQPLSGPAVEQLQGQGAIPHQRRPQQPQQQQALRWIEQIQPGPQIALGAAGIAAPGLKIDQIDRQLQPIEAQLQQPRRPQRLGGQAGQQQQASQQTAQQAPTATGREWWHHR